jgi:hypothetical protein
VISISNGSVSAAKLIDPSVVSVCLPGFSAVLLNSTGTSGVFETRPVSQAGPGLSPLSERLRGGNGQRPVEALATERVTAQASAYADAAGAVAQQKMHDHEMWAFRGPEPWSDPA